MQQYLRKFIDGCLSPFNLKVVPANLFGFNLFHDLRQVINKDSPVCLDVGANVGQTIEALLKAFSDPLIHAFEPSTKTFQVLQSKKYGNRVFLHNMALGKERQRRQFFNYNSSELSSFLPLDPDKENRFRKDGLESKEIVEVDTVDRFLQQNNMVKIDLLKTDTQGFDLEVLLGARDALQNGCIRNILVELNFVKLYVGQSSAEDIIYLLKQNNFALIDYYEKVRQDKKLAWCTAFFKRR